MKKQFSIIVILGLIVVSLAYGCGSTSSKVETSDQTTKAPEVAPTVPLTNDAQSQPGDQLKATHVAARQGYERYEYRLPRQTCGPSAIALGPDDALWFTETRLCPGIGGIALDGRIREFSTAPLFPNLPGSIVSGRDGALWFAASKSVGRITTEGVVRAYPIPLSSFEVTDITVGADGAIWFSGFSSSSRPQGAIGRIDHGARLLLRTPGIPYHLVTGPDHALWFTQISPPAIWRLAANQSLKHFSEHNEPIDITAGNDGSIWLIVRIMNEGSPETERVGRLDAAGEVKLFATPTGVEPKFVANPRWIARGPDGMWYGTGSSLVRISADGTTVFYSPKSPNSVPSAFAVGPKGDLWFTEFNADAIGRIKLSQ